jgi:acetyltransferase-like isoleucine patch superfamily enzyme
MEINGLRRILAASIRVSLLRSLVASIRTKSWIIIGRGSRVYLSNKASVTASPRSFLLIGIDFKARNGAVLEIGSKGALKVSGRVHITRGSRISVGEGAVLSIGAGTILNENSVIVCNQQMNIGSYCAFGWNNNILDTNLHTVIKNGVKKPVNAPVFIGDHVWTGLGVTILKGVKIGSNSVIAAGSIVTNDVASATLSGGIPNKLISENINWQG